MSTGVRRSPRKHAADASTNGTTRDKQVLDVIVLTASSRQSKMPPTKRSPTKRSPSKSMPRTQLQPQMMGNIPLLLKKDAKTRKGQLQTHEETDKQQSTTRRLAHVDSMLLPSSTPRFSSDGSSSDSEPSFLHARSRTKSSDGSTTAPKLQLSKSSTRRAPGPTRNRYILGEARCNEDVLDSDAIDEEEQDEDTDLSGFIVDDDAELSYHESMESASDDSEQERKTKKPLRPIKPQNPTRRLQRGRRRVSDTADESEQPATGLDADLLDALKQMKIGGQKQHGGKMTTEVVDLTSSPGETVSVNSTEHRGTRLGGQNLFDRFNALRLSPPRATPSGNVPAKPVQDMDTVSNGHVPAEDARPNEVACFTTPPATPPRSPSKLKSPSKLLSPSKKTDFAQRSPHRPSMDAFWDLHVVNEWNDQFSPKKAPLDSPRKGLKHFDLWSDSENEMEAIEESSDGLPSPCESPTKARSIRSPSKNPMKVERARIQAEKKAKLAMKKQFDADKIKIAQDLFDALDKYVTNGQLAKMSSSTGGIQITWSKTLRSTAGRANWKKTVTRPSGSPIKGSVSATESGNGVVVQHYAGIEMASKIVDRPERLYSTLAHEFCHLANFMVSNIQDQPHGASFKRWASKVMQWMCQQTSNPEWNAVKISTKHTYVIEYKYAWICIGREQTKAMGMLNLSDEDGCGTEYGRHSNSINTETQRCGVCKGRLAQIRPKPRASPKKSSSPVKQEVKTRSAVSAKAKKMETMVDIIELSD